jgi:predicted CopG family antitoxin
METTIKISSEVKRALDRMKIYERETYNDVIEFMLEDNLELSEKVKKELEERRNNPKLISHEEVGRTLGL